MKPEDFPQDWSNLLICGLAVLIFVGWGLHSWLKKRPTPEELEKNRRDLLQAIGKMGDGSIAEIQENLIFYTYHVRGIEYMASQDVSSLEPLFPAGCWEMVGPVGVKYDPRNPANSMVLSERWSGLRRTSAKMEQ
jgi:hypothetical protein